MLADSARPGKHSCEAVEFQRPCMRLTITWRGQGLHLLHSYQYKYIHVHRYILFWQRGNNKYFIIVIYVNNTQGKKKNIFFFCSLECGTNKYKTHLVGVNCFFFIHFPWSIIKWKMGGIMFYITRKMLQWKIPLTDGRARWNKRTKNLQRSLVSLWVVDNSKPEVQVWS